jgi:hypothetical protein
VVTNETLPPYRARMQTLDYSEPRRRGPTASSPSHEPFLLQHPRVGSCPRSDNDSELRRFEWLARFFPRAT